MTPWVAVEMKPGQWEIGFLKLRHNGPGWVWKALSKADHGADAHSRVNALNRKGAPR